MSNEFLPIRELNEEWLRLRSQFATSKRGGTRSKQQKAR